MGNVRSIAKGTQDEKYFLHIAELLDFIGRIDVILADICVSRRVV
jgi:hypothetical protein